MTQAIIGAVAPITLRRAIPYLPGRLRATFGIKTVFHDRASFMGSPGAALLGWDPAVPPEITAGRFNNPATLLDLVLQLIGHVDLMATGKDPAPWGEVHVLESAGSHSYVHVSPWVEGVSATPGDVREFRRLMHCFPSALGELPDHRLVDQPGLIAWLTGGDEQREQQSRFEAIEAYRTRQWADKHAVLGPYFRLGISSIIRVEQYTEVFDETRQLLIRCGTMGTTDFHVFDGRYSWMVVTDLARKRSFLVGIGGGRHPIPEMDLVNPLGGAAVLSTTFRSFLLALEHGIDLSQNAKGQLDALAARHDPELAFGRFILSEGDAWGVPMALSRQGLGSNLTAEQEAMHRQIRATK
ncbi:hypothetical protein [Micromonospora sp. DT233]|uniref:hypothetical protein n=1 Tax=Micromonospora sp. DT233 TaxID=3393432 RepID=UPI003CEE0AAF